MPRKPIDYSKSCVYRFVNNNITYYVGSTTNFTKRKAAHKSACNNKKNIAFNTPFYSFIRRNGGWSNDWRMILVETYPNCKSGNELRMLEQGHIDNYRPCLNTYKAYISLDDCLKNKKEKINCQCGGIFTFNNKIQHLITKRHKKYVQTI